MVLIVLALSAGQPAVAQMTYCLGDDCTQEVNGVKRKLTPEEVAKMRRTEARTSISNVRCEFSDDPETCRIVQKSLFEMFPF